MSNGVGLRQVGEFIQQRPIIRAIPNPLDKSTIVSIYPKDWEDRKETTQPYLFKVKGGTIDEPGLTLIKAATYTRDDDAEKPLQEIPISSIQMCESIIKDYCGSLLGATIGVAQPGMFFIPGEITTKDVKTKYTSDLIEAEKRQNQWFDNLVKLADSLWSKGGQNPLMIWSEMKFAAEQLGIDREWLRNYQHNEMVKCFACGSLRNPEYPICANCKNVDMTHPRAKDIKFAV